MITAEQLEERSQENNSKLSGMFSRKDAYEKLLQNEDIKTILKDIEEKILEQVSVGSRTLYYNFSGKEREIDLTIFDIIRNHGYNISFRLGSREDDYPRLGYVINWTDSK